MYPVSKSRVAVIVLVAFAVRLSFMIVETTYKFDKVDDWSHGSETANIASSIVRGEGFSSPFGRGNTGPTALLAPVHPYVVALVYSKFGILTDQAAAAIFTIQALFSALTIIPLIGIAGYVTSKRAALITAWLWAVFPYFSKWSVTWVWEMSFSALFLTTLIWYVLSMKTRSTNAYWVGLGLFGGLSLLVNPGIAVVIPAAVIWYHFGAGFSRKHWLGPAIAMTICLGVLAPWLIRNHVWFNNWSFVRDGFAAEFYQSNFHNSAGRGDIYRQPMGSQMEYNDYARMGEAEYLESRRRAGIEYVQAYPMEFVVLTLHRIAYFWDGSMLLYHPQMPWYWMPWSFAVLSTLGILSALLLMLRKPYGWQLILGVLLLYPVPYYLTVGWTRYRHPIEPLLLLITVYGINSLVKGGKHVSCE